MISSALQRQGKQCADEPGPDYRDVSYFVRSTGCFRVGLYAMTGMLSLSVLRHLEGDPDSTMLERSISQVIGSMHQEAVRTELEKIATAALLVGVGAHIPQSNALRGKFHA